MCFLKALCTSTVVSQGGVAFQAPKTLSPPTPTPTNFCATPANFLFRLTELNVVMAFSGRKCAGNSFLADSPMTKRMVAHHARCRNTPGKIQCTNSSSWCEDTTSRCLHRTRNFVRQQEGWRLESPRSKALANSAEPTHLLCRVGSVEVVSKKGGG